MLLATTQVEDFDRFLEVFSTTGAEKRKEHGSKSALVFRDPSEDDRVWVVFDWDEQGWQSFVSDPEVPPIMKEAGHKARAAGRAVRRPLRRLTPAAPWGGAGSVGVARLATWSRDMELLARLRAGARRVNMWQWLRSSSSPSSGQRSRS